MGGNQRRDEHTVLDIPTVPMKPASAVPTRSAHRLLDLQRTAGNAAVARLIADRADPALQREDWSGTFGLGKHGNKKNEQGRLGEKFGTTISGDTHESEHTIGYEVLRGGDGALKRGDSAEARRLENVAPAYQEEKPFHRAHIGTGSRKQRDTSGWNATSYRSDQRTALEEGHVGNAVQLNQLGYAFIKDFQQRSEAEGRHAADDSYDTMVEHIGSVEYGTEGGATRTAGVSAEERAEMELSRRVARGEWLDKDGKNGFPPLSVENEVRKKHGLPEVSEPPKQPDKAAMPTTTS